MIATPIRWIVMVGIAACGFFLIDSQNMSIRAAAFVASLILWQIHGILMVSDGYALVAMKSKAKKDQLLSIETLFMTLKQDYDFSDAELEVMLRKLKGDTNDETGENNQPRTNGAKTVEAAVLQVA